MHMPLVGFQRGEGQTPSCHTQNFMCLCLFSVLWLNNDQLPLG